MTRRIKKSEQIAEALMKGERRAATSGTGGNEVNAIRQNIRAILDSPKKRAGYTADELEAMEKIARGSAATNTLRGLGKLSPTTGALQQFTGGGLYAGAAATGNPLLAIPPTVGFLAKAGAEGITNSQVKSLQELIRNGGPLAKKTLSGGQRSAIAALLASKLNGGTSPQ